MREKSFFSLFSVPLTNDETEEKRKTTSSRMFAKVQRPDMFMSPLPIFSLHLLCHLALRSEYKRSSDDPNAQTGFYFFIINIFLAAGVLLISISSSSRLRFCERNGVSIELSRKFVSAGASKQAASATYCTVRELKREGTQWERRLDDSLTSSQPASSLYLPPLESSRVLEPSALSPDSSLLAALLNSPRTLRGTIRVVKNDVAVMSCQRFPCQWCVANIRNISNNEIET